MKEARMQTFFSKHLQEYPPEQTEVYELKLCKGTALPFNAVKEHQIKALLECEEGKGFFHKITDPPMFYGSHTRFNVKRPFDCFFIKKVKSYVVLWFYVPRQPKVFIKIRIKDFLNFRDKSSRKSITEQQAINIAESLVKI